MLIPNRRKSSTTKIKIGRRSVYATVGFHEGSPVEIFVDTSREGSELRALMNAFAMVTSRLLQRGDDPKEVAKMLKTFPKDEIPFAIGQVLEDA